MHTNGDVGTSQNTTSTAFTAATAAVAPAIVNVPTAAAPQLAAPTSNAEEDVESDSEEGPWYVVTKGRGAIGVFRGW